MPTPAERKALLFLAGVIVLGASVRVVRAARDDGAADATSRAALARQLAAVDSAHESEAGATSTKKTRSGRRSAPARRGRSSPMDSTAAIDTTSESARKRTGWRRASQSGEVTQSTPTLPVDLDIASAAEIEPLPRIGPVLARRIIEDRDQHGPFGSLEGFERVRGVGPALARTLRDRVTFSGTARPSNAVVDQRLTSLSPTSKPPRRRREK